jgi:hypothetical protein
MTEFEGDVAIWGRPVFMPYAIRLGSQNIGNVHLTSNFVNGAGFTIGTPRPFSHKQPLLYSATDNFSVTLYTHVWSTRHSGSRAVVAGKANWIWPPSATQLRSVRMDGD